MKMPGMSGLEFIKAGREVSPDSKFFLITGGVEESEIEANKDENNIEESEDEKSDVEKKDEVSEEEKIESEEEK